MQFPFELLPFYINMSYLHVPFITLLFAACFFGGLLSESSGGFIRETHWIDPSIPQEIGTDPIQVKMGELNIPGIITLTPKMKREFTLTYKIEKTPIDVYILLDVSGSMYDTKQAVVSVTYNITAALKELTDDFTLGFGAYSDKEDDYTFTNFLPLTSDPRVFQNIVNNTVILSGYDIPEDAATALTQVALCEKEVGWRPKSRRIVVLFTDSSYHLNGTQFMDKKYDDKHQFDDKCHLLSNGEYGLKDDIDYPKFEQVVGALKNSGIITIFAVTNALADYQKIADLVPPSVVATLSYDSSNIVDILREKYKSIAGSIVLSTAEPLPNGINVEFYTPCKGGKEGKTNKCSDLGGQTTITFRVEIEYEKCTAGGKPWTYMMTIKAAGNSGGVQIPLHLSC